MKKLLLLTAIMIASFSTTYAQGIGGRVQPKKAPRAFKSIEVNSYEYWWGYYTGAADDPNQYTFGNGIDDCDYDVCIQIKGSNADMVGKAVSGMRFATLAKDFMNNVKIWMSKSRPVTASLADVCCVDIDVADIENGVWSEFRFPESYTITEEGVYVGYSFNVKGMGAEDYDALFPVLISFDGGVSGGCWFKANGSSWKDWSSAGNLAMQLLIAGDVAQNCAYPLDFVDVVTLAGESGTTVVTIQNKGAKGIKELDYKIVKDGVESEETHYVLSSPIDQFDGTTELEIELQANDSYKRAPVEFIVTKVNGENNEAVGDDRSSWGGVITVAESLPRRCVMEEFTGTWCGWCPRGTTALRLCEEKYGDNFIGIAVHGGFDDPMQINEYSGRRSMVSGFPFSHIDRIYECDPYTGYDNYGWGSDMIVEWELKQLTEGMVDVSLNWANDDKTSIKADASVTFGFENDAVVTPYALAYLLIADGLTGTTEEWEQSNYFAGDNTYRNEENLKEWYDRPSHITDMVYNHVPVAGYGVTNGIDGSVSGPFEVGQAVAHSQTFDISDNKLVQDKNQLKVCVLLLNTQTGQIVNAVERGIDTATGIDLISEKDKQPATRYDLSGRRMQKPQKGLAIERRTDGSVRKIILK